VLATGDKGIDEIAGHLTGGGTAAEHPVDAELAGHLLRETGATGN
jgi:hypothetical protein